MTPNPPASGAAATPSPVPARAGLTAIHEALATRVLGKHHELYLALTCLLADGHLLIEDVPGVGKTTLAHALAQVFGLSFSRVQFTSDLMPSDILGVSIFNRNTTAFEFKPGPIFAELVLVDEVNRASPRTQSALLEAMSERQITVEGVTRELAPPFNVIATQNPVDHSGTFALPDSQMDRFLMRIGLGYPPAEAERQLLAEGNRRAAPIKALATSADLLAWQAAAARLTVRDAVLDYLLRLIHYSRRPGLFEQGLSPRAGLALRRAAQAWALLAGRDFVMPEDIQAVLASVADHRLIRRDGEREPASALLLEHVAIE